MTKAAQVGAFFDIDGTLLPPPSLERRFVAYLVGRRQISPANAWQWLAQAGSGSPAANKAYLRGLRESLVRDWEESLTDAGAKKLGLAPAGLAQINWHLARQHRVFLVSGTLEPLACALARTLKREIGVCATRLKGQGGFWTGAIEGQHMSGGSKVEALRSLARQHDLALDDSYGYGNSTDDVAMLGAVGHPAAVNPTWRLARIARRRGWAVYTWRELPRQSDRRSVGMQLESRRMP